jgi:ABC-type molybdate transport system substrate-binding protein
LSVKAVVAGPHHTPQPGQYFIAGRDCQQHVFSAAIVAGSKESDAARRLIEFLTSAHAAAAIRKYGMEPLGKRGAN